MQLIGATGPSVGEKCQQENVRRYHLQDPLHFMQSKDGLLPIQPGGDARRSTNPSV